MQTPQLKCRRPECLPNSKQHRPEAVIHRAHWRSRWNCDQVQSHHQLCAAKALEDGADRADARDKPRALGVPGAAWEVRSEGGCGEHGSARDDAADGANDDADDDDGDGDCGDGADGADVQ